MAVIREVFSAGQGRARDDAIREIAQALGYERVGARIADVLDGDIRTAVRRGILENTNGELQLLCRGIGDYTRDHLVNMLMSEIGGGWWDRDELIRSTAHHLGFRRTGSEIRKALRSAINGAIRRGLLEYDGDRVRKLNG